MLNKLIQKGCEAYYSVGVAMSEARRKAYAEQAAQARQDEEQIRQASIKYSTLQKQVNIYQEMIKNAKK